jgi:hypothetical protein
MKRFLLALVAVSLLSLPGHSGMIIRGSGGGGGGIVHIQSKTVWGGATEGTIAATFDSSVTAGNFIVASVHGYNTYATGVADTGSNSYTKDLGGTNRNNLFSAQVSTGGTLTVTATLNASTNYRAITISEYSGVATSSAYDNGAVATAARSGSTDTDGDYTDNVTTSVDGCLIVGSIVNTLGGWGTIVAGTGLTQRGIGGDDWHHEDKILASAGTTNATWTAGDTDDYRWIIGAYKPQ